MSVDLRSLELVSWTPALEELRLGAGAGPDRRSSRLLAAALSLSARFEASYGEGAKRIAEARALAPLGGVHAYRSVLHALRFGRWDDAAAAAQALQALWADQPLPLYLHALANLRAGRTARANSLATQLVEFHPAFAPGRFLRAECLSRVKLKGLEQVLMQLPSGPEHAPAWCDLLCKLALDGPARGAKIGAQYADRLPAGSRAEALARRALATVRAEEPAGGASEQAFLETAPGSRAEQVALVTWYDELRAEHPEDEGVQALHAIQARSPDRPALRRLYVAVLSRRAAAIAGKDRLHEALRLVEVCIRLEPQELLHRHNRAALFTLLREEAGYHQAWEDVDRHHYRLALLGQVDPSSARAMRAPHLMFAEHARLVSTGRAATGVFREEPVEGEGHALAVNQERLDSDPEMLRQWIHHRRAELVFAHLALGPSPSRFLLHPDGPREAAARAEALALAARSLAVLVPEEGRQLGEALAARWKALARGATTRYGAPPKDAEVQALQRAHLDDLADLALLAFRWSPPGLRPELVEEVLELLRAEAPFFDEGVLHAALAAREGKPTVGHKILAHVVREVAGTKDDEARPSLEPAQRAKVARHFEGVLLSKLARRTFEDRGGVHGGLEPALELVDRARAATPEDPDVEELAARLLTAGELFEEARAAVKRFRTLARAANKANSSSIDEVEQSLQKAQGNGTKGRTRAGRVTETGPVHAGPRDVEELEQEVERSPSFVHGYADLARALAKQGHSEQAIAWAERAMARCLGSEGQLHARALHLEMLGLAEAARTAPEPTRRYLEGAAEPLLEALSALPDEVPYPVNYLRGLCCIKLRRRVDAQEAFANAAVTCPRQFHRTVLRRLAAGVDQALCEQARAVIAEALHDGRMDEAVREAAETFAGLQAPAVFLQDLARLQLAAVVANAPPPPVPPAPAGTPWAARLEAIARVQEPLPRCRQLVELWQQLVPERRKEGEALLRRLEALEEQLQDATAFAESSRLLREGKAAESLAALEQLGDAARATPRMARQRVLLLLRLERFAEADAAFAQLAAAGGPLAGELAARYPKLVFQHRLAAIQRLVRAGADADASALLSQTQAPGEREAVELAYCRAYLLAQQAYRADRAGDPAGAVRHLREALDRLEEHLAAARRCGHTQAVELQARLDRDLATLEAAA